MKVTYFWGKKESFGYIPYSSRTSARTQYAKTRIPSSDFRRKAIWAGRAVGGGKKQDEVAIARLRSRVSTRRRRRRPRPRPRPGDLAWQYSTAVALATPPIRIIYARWIRGGTTCHDAAEIDRGAPAAASAPNATVD